MPTNDPHLSEYTAPYYQRREYISGFTGSAGTAVVTCDAAVLFTDGRYHQQASLELDDTHWTLMKSGLQGVPTINEWLLQNLGKGASVGIDPSLHATEYVLRTRKMLETNELQIKVLSANPIDIVWNCDGRPSCISARTYSCCRGYTIPTSTLGIPQFPASF